MVKLFNFVAMLMLLAIATPALAAKSKPITFKSASDKSLYVATTGEVILTFLSKSAVYSDNLFLLGSPDKILNNQTAISGQQFSLGSFQAGTELVFSIYVEDTGYSFYNGIAKRNPDKTLHTAYKVNKNRSVTIGFEDLFKGKRRDYNDLVFSLSNVRIAKYVIPPIPEPEIYTLLLAGLLLIGAAKRRNR